MISMVRDILRFSGGYAGRIRAAYPIAFLKSICMNAPLMIAIRLLPDLISGTATLRTVWTASAVLLGCFLLQSLLQYWADRLQSGAGFEIFSEKRIEFGRHLRRLPMGFFSAGNLGRISTILSQDMVYIEEQSMMTIAGIISDIFAQVILTGFLFYFDMRIGAAALVTEAVAVIAARFMIRKALENSIHNQNSIQHLTDAVLEYTEGFGVIRSFNMTGRSAKDLAESFTRMRDTSLAFESSYVPYERALQIIYGLGTTAILSVSICLAQLGELSPERFLGLVLFLFSLFTPLRHLYQQTVRMTIMKNSLDRIEEIFAEKEIDDAGTDVFPPAADHEIEFRNVSFAYENEPVLKNISFAADRGRMIALVGKSGSGKTTVANLLARFWDIADGEILIRSKNIKSVPIAALMEKISMVFQNVYLFEDTIYNNIAMGNPDATRVQVIEAAKKARCYDFITALPYGFDTLIGEGGATLSGGEAQRISIARCILKDAPIIVLDEATASIDADNEAYIQQALTELCREKTTIVIAHRLQTVRNADRLLVLDRGELIESGTHEELIAADGVYSRMVKAGAESPGWNAR